MIIKFEHKKASLNLYQYIALTMSFITTLCKNWY